LGSRRQYSGSSISLCGHRNNKQAARFRFERLAAYPRHARFAAASSPTASIALSLPKTDGVCQTLNRDCMTLRGEQDVNRFFTRTCAATKNSPGGISYLFRRVPTPVRRLSTQRQPRRGLWSEIAELRAWNAMAPLVSGARELSAFHDGKSHNPDRSSRCSAFES